MSLTKIGSIGINTGIQLAGVTTVSTLHVGSGVTLSSDGDVFATGISTFSEDIKVGSGVTISPDGDGFYTGVVTATTFSGSLAASSLTGALPAISGANLTNLDASDLASGTVPTARLGSGTASSSTFLRGDSTFQTVNTDLVSDTSPQLGGNLDVNTKNILFGDSASASDDRLIFGAGSDLQIFHESNHSYIQDAGTGSLILVGNNITMQNAAQSENMFSATQDGGVNLYYDNSLKLVTGTDGEYGSVEAKTGKNGWSGFSIGGYYAFIANNEGSADQVHIFNDLDNESFIIARRNAEVELFHNGTMQCETSSVGLKFPSGKGIDFSATSDGAGTDSSELFDDYEEGTWTPTCATGTLSYGHQSYTKIGRMCYVTTYVNNFSDRSSSSAITITGLPYAPANESDCGACVLYRVAHTDEGQVAARTSTSSNGILFLVSSQGGSESWFHLTHSDLNHTTSQIKFSIWYAVA